MSSHAEPPVKWLADWISNFGGWCAHVLRRSTSRAEFRRLSRDEVEAIARDLNISMDALKAVVSAGERVTPLVSARLATAGLTVESVQQANPAVLRDMLEVCAGCCAKKQCEQELDETGHLKHVEGICPNTSTVAALNGPESKPKLAKTLVWPVCC